MNIGYRKMENFHIGTPLEIIIKGMFILAINTQHSYAVPYRTINAIHLI